jgi:hypothetical protein
MCLIYTYLCGVLRNSLRMLKKIFEKNAVII